MASKHFGGNKPLFEHLVRPRSGLSGEIWNFLRRVESAFLSNEQYTRQAHVSFAGGSPASSAPGQQPDTVVSGTLFLIGFTVNSDDLFGRLRFPDNFVGTPAVHVHWSKTTDADQAGNSVRWRFSYTVHSDDGAIANGSPIVVDLDDTYDASDTTERRIYRTADAPLVGITAGSYMSAKLEAVTPGGSALTVDPGIFGVDVTFDELIND